MESNNPNVGTGQTKIQMPNGVNGEKKNDDVAPDDGRIKTVKEEQADRERELQEEYIDKRTIIISLTNNYSNFRKVNMVNLGQIKATIGSSIRSCRTLISHRGEVEKYYPELLGISSNHPDFIQRVKTYLSNIQCIIDNNDKHLDCTFVYRHKSDYLKIHEQEEKILNEFDAVNRSDIKAIKEAAEKRDKELDMLESTKYQYGYPVNLEEYLLYRHCLLYSEVAKDTAFIATNPNYRFYIKDENKEKIRQQKLVKERKDAMRKFVELDASSSKTEAVYIAMTIYNNGNVAQALAKDSDTKINELMNFANTNPAKFNKFVTDRNIELKAFIETLISRGMLIRSDYNQQISVADDGTYVGANMIEAISFFNNPNNAIIKEKFKNALRLS